MNEYEVSDYSIFTNAAATTTKLNSDLSTADSTVTEAKTVLGNGSIFMGPIADNCVESLGQANTKISELTDGFNKIITYLQETMDAYQRGDTSALQTITSVNVGDVDMSNYPRDSSRESGMIRAELVARYLMKNGGFTAEQAAAIVGVYLDENNCDPGEVMEAEKARGGNYGAGIGSWTFDGTKRRLLQEAGYDPDKVRIEDLDLQQQCDMLLANTQASGKKYYDALKRCETIEDASATAVVITGGKYSFHDWENSHPTPADAKRMADTYGASNDANYGPSAYHWNLDVRRLDYAKKVLARLQA